MKKLIFAFALCIMAITSAQGQDVIEPDFIGEVDYFENDSSLQVIDKEYGNTKNGVSWRYNSLNATSLYVNRKAAKTRFKEGQVKLVVKASNNDYDPMSVITVYRFKSSKNKRSAEVYLDNSGTMMSSKSVTNNRLRFKGKKYGKTSYLVTMMVPVGEYGIVVNNPNVDDHREVVIYCFGVDKPDNKE